MQARKFILLRLVAVLGFILPTACTSSGQGQRVEGYLLTLFSLPRVLGMGEAQLVVRLQDPDFKIITKRKPSLTLLDCQTGKSSEISLKPGPGKDFRGWVFFPTAGKYIAQINFVAADSRTLSAWFELKIPNRARRQL